MLLYNKLKNVAVAVLVIFLAGACTGDFESLNDNPSLVLETEVQPQAILTGVLKNSIFATYSAAGGRIGEFAGYYASQSSGNLFETADYGSPFNWYSYVLNTNEILRLTADDTRMTNLNAMARIWKAYLYHIMTDAYGDIPYTEAALGVANAINQPEYDTQQAIYTDLLKELKEAAAQLGSQEDQLPIGNADILYQGNVDNWKRFANSLRLRLAIRVRFADAALAATHINEVINASLIVDNNQNASVTTLPPSDTEDVSNVNYMYNRVRTSTTPIFVGFAIADVMIPNDDPRMPVYFMPGSGGTYRARPIQLAEGQKAPWYAQDTVASVGPVLFAETYEIIVFNAAEVYFLRAEAALANITGEDKEAMYLEGIQHSMEQYGIEEDDITAFLNQEGVDLSGTEEEQFEKIINQKYIATFFQAYEAYAEYRRTGYPKIWIGNETGATDHIPRRLTYPTREYLINEENVMEAASRIGGDNLSTRIWWDVRPGLPFEHPRQNVFPPN